MPPFLRDNWDLILGYLPILNHLKPCYEETTHIQKIVMRPPNASFANLSPSLWDNHAQWISAWKQVTSTGGEQHQRRPNH